MKANSIAMTTLAMCLAAFPAAAGPAEAPQAAAPAPVDKTNLVTVKLLETSDLVVPGDEVVLLLQATVAKDWHTYWNGPSDTGYPLKPTWTLPEGWKLVKIEWPVPKRYVSPGEILDHVYEGQPTLVVTLKAPAEAKPGPAAIAVDVAWLACMEACIPGHAKASVELKIAPPGIKPTATNIDPHMSARAALPVHLKPGDDVILKRTLEQRGNDWAFRIRAGRAERIRFFPGPECATIPDLLREGDVDGTESVLHLDAKDEQPPRVQGIIQIVYPGDPKSGKPGRVSSFSIDTAEGPENQSENQSENRAEPPSASPAAANPGG
jgi:DsbC/DsbD-like thiol-disulfide interchange protein